MFPFTGRSWNMYSQPSLYISGICENKTKKFVEEMTVTKHMFEYCKWMVLKFPITSALISRRCTRVSSIANAQIYIVNFPITRSLFSSLTEFHCTTFSSIGIVASILGVYQIVYTKMGSMTVNLIINEDRLNLMHFRTGVQS